MHFAHLYIIWIVAVLAMGIVGFFFWKKRQKKMNALRIPFLGDLQKAAQKSSTFSFAHLLKYAQWIFFLLAIISLTVALARPQTMSEEKKITKNGVDILVALDVSESMLAEDLKPNRIEAAKKYINDFVGKLKNDRIGLEVFAGKPFTQSPMSFDYNVVKYYLSEISTDTINQRYRGLNGTAIGDAIVAAINRFENNKDRTKVLILLTDGEANVGVDPVFAAEHARSKGIKIYTIGLGDKNGAPLKVKDGFGHTQYARNPDGSIYKTKFDEQALKNIAQVSGGKYFYAGNNDSLEKSFETINTLEKKEYEAETTFSTEDHFFWWLFWGCIFAMISSGILFLREIFPVPSFPSSSSFTSSSFIQKLPFFHNS